MKRLSLLLLLVSAIIAAPRAQAPAEKLDAAMIARIKDEGLRRSQVMDHISWLSDVYGPRLTGGPGIRQASDWALKIAAPWADFESGGRPKVKALPGHEAYPLTPDQLAAWRKSAEPIVADWEASVKKAGADPKAVLDDLKKTVAKHNSSY